MAALEVNRVVVVRQLSVWLGDREPDLGGDVAWVLALGPQAEGPGAFSATRLLLQVVDCTAVAKRLGRHIFCPAVDWDAFNTNLDPELPVGVVGIQALKWNSLPP